MPPRPAVADHLPGAFGQFAPTTIAACASAPSHGIAGRPEGRPLHAWHYDLGARSRAIALSSARSSDETRLMPKMPPDAAAISSQYFTRSSADIDPAADPSEFSVARISRVALENTCGSGRLASH